MLRAQSIRFPKMKLQLTNMSGGIYIYDDDDELRFREEKKKKEVNW